MKMSTVVPLSSGCRLRLRAEPDRPGRRAAASRFGPYLVHPTMCAPAQAASDGGGRRGLVAVLAARPCRVSPPGSACARSPTTIGRPSDRKASRLRRISRLCAVVLPKPMPGSMSRFSSFEPLVHRPVEPLHEEGVHLLDHVLVDRVVLHGLGLAQHVHEDHRAAGVADHGHHLRVHAQRGDVVDHVGARPPAPGPPPGPCRCRPRCGRAASPARALHHRQHPPQLLLQRTPGRSRAGWTPRPRRRGRRPPPTIASAGRTAASAPA